MLFHDSFTKCYAVDNDKHVSRFDLYSLFKVCNDSINNNLNLSLKHHFYRNRTQERVEERRAMQMG